MTAEKQILALAELDGITGVCDHLGCKMGWMRSAQAKKLKLAVFGWNSQNDSYYVLVSDYTQSYDAIIPLIVKWCNEVEHDYRWHSLESLVLLYGSRGYNRLESILSRSPAQLSEALLRAAAKWEVGESKQ